MLPVVVATVAAVHNVLSDVVAEMAMALGAMVFFCFAWFSTFYR